MNTYRKKGRKNKMKMFELIPNNGRKSFYGKAKVIDHENGFVSLVSYSTIVCSIDTKTGEFKKHWNGYSLTTMQHINSFRNMYGLETMSKKHWNLKDTVIH